MGSLLTKFDSYHTYKKTKKKKKIMALELGNLANAFTTENFDIPLPAAVIEDLNQKLGINANGELFFDHIGVSGKLGLLEGKINWNNGNNFASYKNEIQNGGWKGSHKYSSAGDVGEILQDVFGINDWATYQENGEVNWDIDLLNMDASFGVKDTTTGTGLAGQALSFSAEAKLGVDLDLTDSDATLSFKPSLKYDDEIDYNGSLKFVVPSVENCENYFSGVNFNERSECQLNVKSSDLDDPIILKFKNKFAFLKDGSDIFYVKSENRNGDMVPFTDLLFVSFYYNDNTKGRAFNTIRRKASASGNDLYLTVPLVDAIMSEVLPATMAYAQKWGNFANNLFSEASNSIVKAVYWMDQWVTSVEPTTFDLSGVVAASRFGFAGYPNSQAVADAEEWATQISYVIKEQSFEDLVDARAFVDDIVNAENEAMQKFNLPA